MKREYGSDAVTRGRDPGETMFWGFRVEAPELQSGRRKPKGPKDWDSGLEVWGLVRVRLR